jgi:archaellum component FlaF (FlaF/FlaG flagellin family)
MKVQTISYDAVDDVGSSSPLVMNTNCTPFNVGFGVVVTSTVNYTVQHTFDDPALGFGGSTKWFDHPTVANVADDQDGNYAFPVTAIRITVNSGGGSVTMNVVQAGIA